MTQLLACVRSRPKPVVQPTSEPENPQPQPNIKPAVPAAKPVAPLLSVLSDRYLKEKALSWAPKELSNQKNYIGCFIKALGDRPVVDYGKADVVKFKEGLLNSGKSPTTINKYLQKLSLLFNWLVNHQEDRQSLRRIEAAASQGGELTKWIHSGRTSQVYRVG